MAVAFGPHLWCRWVIKHYQTDRLDYPGTGGELARHLLDEAGLDYVTVELSHDGDHYDPANKAVRLEQNHLAGRSLSAVAIAAHEVGHAIQDRDNYKPLLDRHRLILSTHQLQRIGVIIVFAGPVLGVLIRSPALMFLIIAAGILTLSIQVLIHLATLPVELDASFNRALPILDRGGYLPNFDIPAARRLLNAAALTYVSESLMTALNLFRWVRILF